MGWPTYADRHYLSKARRILKHMGREDAFHAVRAAHWRHKNGLEHRCLVALVFAPEVLAEARRRLSPRDFLTPAYAALAAILFSSDSTDMAASARAALLGRPYLPDAAAFDWAAEGKDSIRRLEERRLRPSRSPATEDLAGRQDR